MRKKPGRLLKKLTVVAVLLGLLAAVYYYGFGGAPAPEGAPGGAGGGMPVEMYTVTAAPLAKELDAVGSLEAEEAATLRAEVPGMIAAIHFKEGAAVKKDALLLEIDRRSYREGLNQAKAAYELARLTEARQRKLLKDKFVSEQAVDEAAARLNETTAAVEAAALRLERADIVAPFDGVVGLRDLSIGDFLNVGDPTVEVVALEHMKVQFSVPEKYSARLKEGQKVSVQVDAWPEVEFPGVLYAVAPVVDPQTRNITVKARIPNPEYRLKPGMFAHVRLALGDAAEALIIPEEAVMPQGEKNSVMKVVDGKATPAEVTLGLRREGKVEVRSGLSAGDVIITAGHMKVGPGMPVVDANHAMPPQDKSNSNTERSR